MKGNPSSTGSVPCSGAAFVLLVFIGNGLSTDLGLAARCRTRAVSR